MRGTAGGLERLGELNMKGRCAEPRVPPADRRSLVSGRDHMAQLRYPAPSLASAPRWPAAISVEALRGRTAAPLLTIGVGSIVVRKGSTQVGW